MRLTTNCQSDQTKRSIRSIIGIFLSSQQDVSETTIRNVPNSKNSGGRDLDHDFQPDSGVPAMPNLVKPISEFVTLDCFVTTIATAEFVLESVEDPFDTAMIEFDIGASATPVRLE